MLECSSFGAIVMIQQEDIGRGALHFSAEGFGQSFTTDSDFLAVGIELHMKASPFGARTTTVDVFEYSGTMTTFGNSPPIATGVIQSNRVSNTQSWIMAHFSTPVYLTSKRSYAFVASDGVSSSNQFYFASTDAFSNGAWLNIGSGGALTPRTIDSAFRVYAIPEASICTLVCIGFMVPICKRQRRIR